MVLAAAPAPAAVPAPVAVPALAAEALVQGEGRDLVAARAVVVVSVVAALAAGRGQEAAVVSVAELAVVEKQPLPESGSPHRRSSEAPL
jgi:hypothetical protein